MPNYFILLVKIYYFWYNMICLVLIFATILKLSLTNLKLLSVFLFLTSKEYGELLRICDNVWLPKIRGMVPYLKHWSCIVIPWISILGFEVWWLLKFLLHLIITIPPIILYTWICWWMESLQLTPSSTLIHPSCLWFCTLHQINLN